MTGAMKLKVQILKDRNAYQHETERERERESQSVTRGERTREKVTEKCLSESLR